MKTAIVNGRVMNASEIADYIERTTGEPIKRETVLERMRKGWTGEKLVAPLGARKKPVTVTIDGMVMGPSELADWIQEHRGYSVGRSALRARMEKGETGERLLRRSRQAPPKVSHRTWGELLPRISIPGWGVKM